MTYSIDQIDWCDVPLIPSAPDPAWEKESATRIESLTRKHDVDILISAEVRSALDARFIVRELSPEHVKGKSEDIVTFAVESFQGDPATERKI